MSLIYFDGFETYATADITKSWNSAVNGPTIATTSGRRSGGTLSCAASAYVALTFPSAESSVVAGCALNFSTLPSLGYNAWFLRLADSGNDQIKLKLNSDGTIGIYRNNTLLGTSSASVEAAAWHYLQIKTVINDTTGSYEVRLDDVNILSASNVDTKDTANASVNQIYLGIESTSGNPTVKVDDFYILNTSGSAPNNNFLGDVRIDAIYPSSDGNYTQWTPSTGVNHYAVVDESTPNTTDYVSDATNGNKDSYGMTNVPALTAQTIYGVMVRAAALKDDAGARSLKVGVRSSTTDSLSSAQAITTSQLYYNNIHETDPATAAAWTESGVNALEALIETAA